MERVDPPKGYILINKDEVSKIMAVEAELLRTEGIDPKWPGFEVPADEPDSDRQ